MHLKCPPAALFFKENAVIDKFLYACVTSVRSAVSSCETASPNVNSAAGSFVEGPNTNETLVMV